MNSYNKHGGRPYLQLPQTILTTWKAFANSFMTSVLTWESLGSSILCAKTVIKIKAQCYWEIFLGIIFCDQSEINQLEKG